MKIARRVFAFLLVSAVAAALLPAQTTEKTSAKKNYLAFVGTYTTKTASKGVYSFHFDAATGKMSSVILAAETKDPSWVVVHPNRKFLYAANEAGKESMISAFAIEPKSGKLTLIKQLPALGEDPCYLSFDRTGKFLLTANYTSGDNAAFEILPDGTPGGHAEPLIHGMPLDTGTLGPNKERQEAPHAHWIQPSLDGHLVYVSDLGLDSILVYRFNPGAWKYGKPVLSWIPSGNGFDRAAVLAPGTGPRHAAFSRDGKFFYVLGELKSTVTVFARHGESFHSVQTVPMLPAGFSGRNDAAEIEIHPNGKFLYASNRGLDSIVVYAIDKASGTLTNAANVPTGGKEPRHFVIDPTGQFLLAENQLSDTIVEFRVDPSTGKLTPTGETLQAPSPVCITFLPIE